VDKAKQVPTNTACTIEKKINFLMTTMMDQTIIRI